jgi:hypothetical protein
MPSVEPGKTISPIESRSSIVAVDAFAPFVQGDEVRFVAACWMMTAGAP